MALESNFRQFNWNGKWISHAEPDSDRLLFEDLTLALARDVGPLFLTGSVPD